MQVVTAAEMRRIDQRTIETYHVPGIVLMENAGLQLVRVMREHVLQGATQRVTIVTGQGNNGGDGFILARHLWHIGVPVSVLCLVPGHQLRGDARTAYRMAQAYGVPMVTCTTPQAWHRQSPALLHATDIIVDAILGTGLNRAVTGVYAEAITALNATHKPILAVDIPSGLSADHGNLLGVHIQATHTVTFALPKRALLLYPAAAAIGQLHVVDIGIPQQAIAAEAPSVTLIQAPSVGQKLPMRRPDAHKGHQGHLLVVAGSLGKAGAGVLASHAAFRAGVGLVTWACPARLLRMLAQCPPEIMTLPVSETTQEPYVTAQAIPALCDFVQHTADALVLGPGLGTHPETVACVQALLQAARVPVVIDADGLNCLAAQPALLRQCAGPVIITPHPGEMARLVATDIPTVQAQRLEVAAAFARDYHVYVVLKGAHTVIAAPDGHCWLNPTGNAAMATAGTGDVLTGILGALLCQGLSPLEAAQCGVYLHGVAGDRVAQRQGNSGVLASDLIHELPHARRALQESE